MKTNPDILLPLDFSDAGKHAIHAAQNLANLLGGTITPFHVYMPVSDFYSPGMYGLETSSAPAVDPAEMKKIHEQSLRDAVNDELPAELINEYTVAVGKAHQAITEAAHDFDLIVMGSHGRSGFSRFFMGSVSDKVLRKAHIPVLVVNENQQFRPVERIMVTTDFSDYSKQAFPVAKQIAQKTNATVELVHILSFNTHDQKEPDEEIRNKRRQQLDDIVSKHFGPLDNNVKPRLIISTDSPPEAIINDNLNNPHDLIIMAAVGRTGIEHLTMGGTASKVVRYAKSPVLSINPKNKSKNNNG